MDVLLDEVESLEAILMDDVRITRNEATGHPELIETTVLPTVGDSGTDTQYVCVTLQVRPGPNYPDTQPQFALRNPRGLDDHSIECIRAACHAKLAASIGAPVVFDLIEVVREHLTESNLPTGQCVVCLYGFSEGDAFTKTACYHYLHSYCLARHLLAAQRNWQEDWDKLPAWQQLTAAAFQATCPVCREPIQEDVEPLRRAAAPADLSSAPRFEVTHELRLLQARMGALFARQKASGGIIERGEEGANVLAIETEAEQRARLRAEAEAEANELQKMREKKHPVAAAVATVAAVQQQQQHAKKAEAAAEEEEEEGETAGGRGRYARFQSEQQRRGGNRHHRRRQFHTSHSSSSTSSSSAAASGPANGNGGQSVNATATR